MSRGPPLVSAIVAMAQNRVIGQDNRLPWHLSEDLRRFKRLTLGKPLVLGRKTYDSIGRPLPGRRMVVVTRRRDWRPEGVEVVHSVDEALARCADAPEVVLGGGAELFREAWPRVGRLYLTVIAHDFPGDVHFPEVDLEGWRLTEDEAHPPSAAFPHPYRFLTYERP